MSVNGINTRYQNYAPSGNSGSKSSSGANAFDSFQNALSDWEARAKDKIEKEQADDSSGNLEMSEKQWKNLMNKVDGAIDAFKDNVKEQEQTAKRQADEKRLIAAKNCCVR